MGITDLYMVILSSYIISSLTYASSQWPSYNKYQNILFSIGLIFGLLGITVHGMVLFDNVVQKNGLHFSIANIISLIGFQLAFIAILASLKKEMCGFSAGILLISSVSALLLTSLISGFDNLQSEIKPMTWQIKTHIFTSVFAYAMLCAGSIIAIFALIQDQRLRNKKLSSLNALFAPLETTEKIIFDTASLGSISLMISIFSGIIFIENLFSQHLAHKTVLSIIALIMFAVLVYGRKVYGWRGRSAIYLYLSAFFMLAISYFGSRFMLENVLGRTWS